MHRESSIHVKVVVIMDAMVISKPLRYKDLANQMKAVMLLEWDVEASIVKRHNHRAMAAIRENALV